jgi:hypothetical protein
VGYKREGEGLKEKVREVEHGGCIVYSCMKIQ